jgi:two-component system LytT family sensor kinase
MIRSPGTPGEGSSLSRLPRVVLPVGALLGVLAVEAGLALCLRSGGGWALQVDLISALAYWGSWLTAAPAFALAARYPLARDAGLGVVAANVGLALLGCAAHTASQYTLAGLGIGPPVAARLDLPTGFAVTTLRGLWTYVSLLGFGYAVGHARSLERKEREAARQAIRLARAEAELAKAGLEMLRSRLHPHFLFNSLNSIVVLIDQDPAGARAMVQDLSTLLRHHLRDLSVDLVPLRRELEFTERYVSIQRMRFGDALSVEYQVAAEALDGFVPVMIVQPLVENAIRHAVEVRGQGAITVSARRDQATLEIAVIDEGGSESGEPRPGAGVGLELLARRLKLLYPGRHDLHLHRANGGTVVRVMLPYVMAG